MSGGEWLCVCGNWNRLSRAFCVCGKFWQATTRALGELPRRAPVSSSGGLTGGADA